MVPGVRVRFSVALVAQQWPFISAIEPCERILDHLYQMATPPGYTQPRDGGKPPV